MRGKILNYDPATGQGLISGEDGQRYTFKGTEYQGDVRAIQPGTEVDFELGEDGQATQIYPLSAAVGRSPVPGAAKSKIAAGILAILIGALGIHKFYLGYTGPGVIMLLLWLFGFLLFGLPSLIIWVIGVVEGIIYLTKTDQEFYEVYEKGDRPWF